MYKEYVGIGWVVGRVTADRVESLRRWLFWVLVLGLAGTETEFLLLEHYEDPSQWVPLVLIAGAIGALVWHAWRPGAGSLRAIQMLMAVVHAGGRRSVSRCTSVARRSFSVSSIPGIGTLESRQEGHAHQGPARAARQASCCNWG